MSTIAETSTTILDVPDWEPECEDHDCHQEAIGVDVLCCDSALHCAEGHASLFQYVLIAEASPGGAACAICLKRVGIGDLTWRPL